MRLSASDWFASGSANMKKTNILFLLFVARILKLKEDFFSLVKVYL